MSVRFQHISTIAFFRREFSPRFTTFTVALGSLFIVIFRRWRFAVIGFFFFSISALNTHIIKTNVLTKKNLLTQKHIESDLKKLTIDFKICSFSWKWRFNIRRCRIRIWNCKFLKIMIEKWYKGKKSIRPILVFFFFR